MTKTYFDKELLYAATGRCKCGAGLAYPLDYEDAMRMQAWVCSRVLKGEVSMSTNHEAFAFSMWKVREETSINNLEKATTRPSGTVALTIGHAECNACGHEWDGEPYSACGQAHHWFPGACPVCGNDCGAGAVFDSRDRRPRVETRYRTVVQTQQVLGDDHGSDR